jgi:hypothetical protein
MFKWRTAVCAGTFAVLAAVGFSVAAEDVSLSGARDTAWRQPAAVMASVSRSMNESVRGLGSLMFGSPVTTAVALDGGVPDTELLGLVSFGAANNTIQGVALQPVLCEPHELAPAALTTSGIKRL